MVSVMIFRNIVFNFRDNSVLHSEGQVGKIVWSLPGAHMDIKVRTQEGSCQIQPRGLKMWWRTMEAMRKKKSRQFEAEKEEGRRGGGWRWEGT